MLAKAFINDNFVFTKPNGIRNDDYLLASYIADLYHLFQKGKKLETSDENTWNEVPRSLGMYISKDEIETIEFFTVEEIETQKSRF